MTKKTRKPKAPLGEAAAIAKLQDAYNRAYRAFDDAEKAGKPNAEKLGVASDRALARLRAARSPVQSGTSTRSHVARKPVPVSVRVLTPSEYPDSITARRGMYDPDVRFVAVHPLGTYYVDHEGAGHFSAYFIPKRKGSRTTNVGGASSMAGAFRRISAHEDELVEPNAPREEGKHGPVNIFALGRRTGGAKTPTQLDSEIAEFLAQYPEGARR